MKKYILTLIVSVLTMSFTSFGAEKIKVACVGDSITFGAGIKNNADKYPYQLGIMLGENYQVENFGVSGSTLLSKGNKPYIKTSAYSSALALKPNIVVIKLGTNDSKMQNWDKISDFEADLISLIDSFANLDSKPTIFLCTPCPAFLEGDKICASRILELIPTIEKVAKTKSLKLIDLQKTLSGKKEYFPDRVHPNAQGAKLMAETIRDAILNR